MRECALEATAHPQPFNWHIDENFKFTGTATVTDEVYLIHADDWSRGVDHIGDWGPIVALEDRRLRQSLEGAMQNPLTEE